MGSLSTTRSARLELVAMSPAGITSDGLGIGLAQHKLNRLLELRAAIDAVRYEREAHDPLLTWVTAQERVEIT